MASQEKQAFIAWVARQPADDKYDYGSTCGCAFAQYLTASGHLDVNVGGFDWCEGEGPRHPLPDDIADALTAPERDADGFRTFGDLHAALVSE